MGNPLVGIVIGSDSDLPVIKAAADMLEKLNIEYEIVISSAHRVPERTTEYAKSAHLRGLKVIIAAAGLAAHLPGVIAAVTPLPVIGVPIKSGALDGVDSLYSIVQMPSGIPVAAVAINGTKNAAILAAQIIGVKDEKVMEKIIQYKKELSEQVDEKNEKLLQIGIDQYLKTMK